MRARQKTIEGGRRGVLLIGTQGPLRVCPAPSQVRAPLDIARQFKVEHHSHTPPAQHTLYKPLNRLWPNTQLVTSRPSYTTVSSPPLYDDSVKFLEVPVRFFVVGFISMLDASFFLLYLSLLLIAVRL